MEERVKRERWKGHIQNIIVSCQFKMFNINFFKNHTIGETTWFLKEFPSIDKQCEKKLIVNEILHNKRVATRYTVNSIVKCVNYFIQNKRWSIKIFLNNFWYQKNDLFEKMLKNQKKTKQTNKINHFNQYERVKEITKTTWYTIITHTLWCEQNGGFKNHPGQNGRFRLPQFLFFFHCFLCFVFFETFWSSLLVDEK